MNTSVRLSSKSTVIRISVERTDQHTKILLPVDTDPIDLQYALSYLKHTEIVQNSKANSKDVERLTKSVKAAMSTEVIKRLKKLDEFSDLKA